MDTFLIGCIVAAVVSSGSAAFLLVKLRETRARMSRMNARMERLDAIADDVALREFESIPTATMTTDEHRRETLDAALEAAWEEAAERSRLDSGKYVTVGLSSSTDEIADDDFLPPRMSPSRQVPNRQRHETPVGSPAGFREQEAVVAVGSIHVRSDKV